MAKHEVMINDEIQNAVLARSFRHSSFELVSSFGFRP